MARGIAEWTGQTLVNISVPPLPFLAFFGVVVLFLSLSGYTDYETQMNKAKTNLEFLLFLLPVGLIFMVRSMVINRSFSRIPRPRLDWIYQVTGSFPWGVVAMLVLLLLMISYQPSFPSLWRSD